MKTRTILSFRISVLIVLTVCLQSFSFSQNISTTRYEKHLLSKSAIKQINSNNNLRIDTLNNITQSIINVLFGGCVEIYNLTYTGPNLSIAYFVDESETLGVDSGIVMTTGSIDNGGFNIQSPVSNFASTNNEMSGDALLESLIPSYTTYDASIIEFDFVPLADSIIGCQYVFASEEYPEYVCSGYNDVFGFFITGPNPAGAAYSNTNLAMIPGSTLPVAINSINNGGINSGYPSTACISTNFSSLYVDNEALNGTNWCYDGYTVPFTITCNVIPNELYHFKIAIADAGDGIYDSGVFLKGGSFLGNIPLPIAKFNTSIDLHTNTVTFTNQSQFAHSYEWDFGDGTISHGVSPVHVYENDGIYEVKLMSTNTCTTDTMIKTVNLLPAGFTESDIASLISISSSEQGLYQVSINADDAILCLTNTNGQQIYFNQSKIQNAVPENIDLRPYSSGIYFLNIIINNEKVSYKILK